MFLHGSYTPIHVKTVGICYRKVGKHSQEMWAFLDVEIFMLVKYIMMDVLNCFLEAEIFTAISMDVYASRIIGNVLCFKQAGCPHS